MTARIRIVNMYTKCESGPGVEVVDTTSKAGWSSDLSPFKIGPVYLYDGMTATNVENAWQFAKLYRVHADGDGLPTPEYWTWARAGWADPKPHRYPMGRGARPLHSWWRGRKLGYVEARKAIYVPLYAEAVTQTPGWTKLQGLYQNSETLVLRDYDGYERGEQSLEQVLNNPERKMGHAFVLEMLLTWGEEEGGAWQLK
jgi:hypothetical protein